MKVEFGARWAHLIVKMVEYGEFLFADVAMLRVDRGGAFLPLLLKVFGSKCVGDCEIGLPAECSNPRLVQRGLRALYSFRGPFTRDGLHVSPPRNRIGKVGFRDGPLK